MRRKKGCFRYQKNNMPLRVYFSSEAVKTLYISALIACFLVTCIMHLYYMDILALPITLFIVLGGLFLSLSFGGHWMLHKAKRIVTPMEEITNAMNKVTEGDFSVQIENMNSGIKEINSMTCNFNTMVTALKGMEYMNKEFINNVSHEVKTPIAAISGLTEILLDDFLADEERTEYLMLMRSETIRLSRLCENMLRISKLDQQTIVTRYDEVNITEQIRKCIILLNERWEAKELELDLELEEVSVTSDPDLLQQVWINLIDNAMKYGTAGTRIHIQIRRLDESVEVAIRDEGPGIPKEKLTHIFERFYQCEESHQKQGSGLGLSIVERILEILKGSIECNSEVGVGTEMIVRLSLGK